MSKQTKLKPIRALVGFVAMAVILFCIFDFIPSQLQKNSLNQNRRASPEQSSELAAFYELIKQVQAAKEQYARVHNIPKNATLTTEQLRAITSQFDYPKNAEGNLVCPGGYIIEIDNVVNRPPELISPCEQLIIDVHVAVKDWAEAHEIPYDATLTQEQIQQITGELDFPKNELGEIVCPDGTVIGINQAVSMRPSMIIRMTFPKGGTQQ